MEKNCAIYLRVSTEDQNPENQKGDVKKLAEALGYKVIETYIDKDSGGYEDRKEFQRMMTDAESGKFKMVFIWALDRFSRQGAGITLVYIERLRKAGVGLKSYQEQWIDTSDEGNAELTISIIAWQAKQERRRIRERVMSGKIRTLGENRIIGCYAPYGYKKVGERAESRFEIEPIEAGVVRLIFKTYLEEQSTHATTKKLYEMGIRTRGRNKEKAGIFHKQTIRKILRNETYIGHWFWGKTSMVEAKYHIKKQRKGRLTGRKKNDRKTWKMVEVPAILDKTTFDRVQEILTKRQKEFTRETKHFYLCRGVLRCVRCGRVYYGRRDCSKRYHTRKGTLCERKTLSFSYVCSARYAPVGEKCYSPKMSVRKLDNIIWSQVQAFISNPEKVKRAIYMLQEKRNNDRTINQRTLDSLMAGQEDIKQQKQRLFKLYALKKYDETGLNNAIEDLDLQEQEFGRQIKEIESKLKKIEDLNAIEREVERLCVEYNGKIANPNPKLKKFIVQKWVSEVSILENGGIKLKMKLPELTEETRRCPSYPTLSFKIRYDLRSIEFEKIISSKEALVSC